MTPPAFIATSFSDMMAFHVKMHFDIDEIFFDTQNRQYHNNFEADEVVTDIHYSNPLILGIEWHWPPIISKKEFFYPMMYWRKDEYRWHALIPIKISKHEYDNGDSWWNRFVSGKHSHGVEHTLDHDFMMDTIFCLVKESLETIPIKKISA